MKQRICQSCGMSMPTDDLLGTHGNGCLCTEYCCHCFQKGFFTNNSLEEQIELNAQPESLAAFNEASGSNFTKEEAIEGLRKFLPTLKRWMPIRQQAEWVLEQCGYRPIAPYRYINFMDDNSLIHRKGKTHQAKFESRGLLCSRSGQRYFNRKNRNTY